MNDKEKLEIALKTLTELSCLGNGNVRGNSIGNDIASAALDKINQFSNETGIQRSIDCLQFDELLNLYATILQEYHTFILSDDTPHRNMIIETMRKLQRNALFEALETSKANLIAYINNWLSELTATDVRKCAEHHTAYKKHVTDITDKLTVEYEAMSAKVQSLMSNENDIHAKNTGWANLHFPPK